LCTISRKTLLTNYIFAWNCVGSVRTERSIWLLCA